MSGNPVVWFEIYVKDMDRAKSFYEAVFRVTLQPLGVPSPEMEMWAFPGDQTSYGTPGALVRLAGVPCGGSGTQVYFHCADCAVEEARVLPAGGQIHRSKMAIGPYGFISLVVDPEGNLVGLHSMA